jgi:hypothetical protein
MPNPDHAVDNQITAIALVNDLTIVTRNVADFEGSGVRVTEPLSICRSRKSRPQPRGGQVQKHTNLERRHSLRAMDEADRRGRRLIIGKDNLKAIVQNRLGDLIGQDARDPEASGRAVDRCFAGVDGQARAHGRADFALRLWVAEDPMLRR